jgi:hypothetical protein
MVQENTENNHENSQSENRCVICLCDTDEHIENINYMYGYYKACRCKYHIHKSCFDLAHDEGFNCLMCSKTIISYEDYYNGFMLNVTYCIGYCIGYIAFLLIIFVLYMAAMVKAFTNYI